MRTGFYYVGKSPAAIRRTWKGEQLFIKPKPIVSRENIDSISVFIKPGCRGPFQGIEMTLDKEGAMKLSGGTRRALRKRIAIVLDNHIVEIGQFQNEISSGKLTIDLRGLDLSYLLALVRAVQAETGP